MSGGADRPGRTRHYVSPAPFDPRSIEALSPEQERYYLASQWRLMWWKLKRHRLALYSGLVLALMYGSILVTEFLAPYDLHTRNIDANPCPGASQNRLKKISMLHSEFRPY